MLMGKNTVSRDDVLLVSCGDTALGTGPMLAYPREERVVSENESLWFNSLACSFVTFCPNSLLLSYPV